ncbi:VPS10 domain-containing protein [Ulvibacter antarcticus]|uniref:Putative secreted protein (Por secretion system target) n=1 Tax=Ulvibacter antarcticus TaxID=442714 RepID=A0A3L9YCT7_9FLAO|nr:T9SS type A sorting domain-containing protein [Ulvibacter antarcticus]RMA58506.1 putative secreted protein (Por secretion system target) [Ulvibacter antarcticus]
MRHVDDSTGNPRIERKTKQKAKERIQARGNTNLSFVSSNNFYFGKRMLLIALFLFGIGSVQLKAQEYQELISNPVENTTLQDIQDSAELYFANRDKGKGSGYKQYKRWEYIMERNTSSERKIRNLSKMNWDVYQDVIASSPQSKVASSDWDNLGPITYTNGALGYNGGLGRVNVIGFHPTDASTIYIGTPAGGLWKTTDGGATWTPIADALASIGISGIAVDHATPSTIYVLTGDGDGGDTFSVGVMKSTDSGASWASTGLSASVTTKIRGFKLLMHPTDSDIMFVVTNAGLLKTTDGWASHAIVKPGSFRDIEFKPGDPSIVYAVEKEKFYKSTDTGATWTEITSVLPAGEKRIAIAVSPHDSSHVYYLAGGSDGAGTFKGLYLSVDSGDSFSSKSTTPNILSYETDGTGVVDQSGYDLAMAVNPLDKDNIITGGINIWRSTDGGASHTAITNWSTPTTFEYVHADIHELVYNPLNNVLYCGTDGGISKSTDDGVTWTNIWDGLEIMQFYKIAGIESDPDFIIGGTQDNGTNIYTGTTSVEHIYGADGGDCMIDYTDKETLYYGTQFGNLLKSTNGGDSFTMIKPGGATGKFVTPYAMDATDPSIIYGGYDDVYRSTDKGSSWTNLESDGRNAIAIGVDDPARIYAAKDNVITTSSDTGATWTTVTGPWPTSKHINEIVLDPDDATNVWVGLNEYEAGEKVYESTDAGATWTNVSGSLPNTPVVSLVYQDTGGSPSDALYVGMAVGVYYKSDSTAWTLYNSGLPNVPIYDLEINYATCKLRAGTKGRGLWETTLYGAVRITDVVFTAPTCPGALDATLTVTASCDLCSSIKYTITPTDPTGPSITQIDDGIFVGLASNSYEVTAENSSSTACITSWTENLVVIPSGADTTPPTVSCMDITVLLGPSGMVTIDETDIDAGSTDNCGIDVMNASPDTFDCSAIGTPVTVTLTATDASGNSSTCTALVTVEDDIPPVASCTDTTISLDASGSITISPTDVDSGSSDNCAIDSMTVSPDTFSCTDIGSPIVVTLTVADSSGNSDTCTATVTIEDSTGPDITCPLDQEHEIDIGDLYEVPDYFLTGEAVAVDNCTTTITVTSQSPSAGTMLDIGTYTVTVTAEDDYGNDSLCTFELTVTHFLGVGQNTLENSILIHPNPVNSMLTITNRGQLLLDQIRIYDMLGKLVSETSLINMDTDQIIDVSRLSSGLYIVQITSESSSLIKQLLVE